MLATGDWGDGIPAACGGDADAGQYTVATICISANSIHLIYLIFLLSFNPIVSALPSSFHGSLHRQAQIYH